MKRVLGLIGVVVMLLLVLSVGNHYENYYTKEVEVVEVDCLEITVRDNNDNEWVYIGDGVAEGQRIKVKMFTNYTLDTVDDDEIVRVK